MIDFIKKLVSLQDLTMYRFLNNTNSDFYHEQKFTLQWDFPEARKVVVKFVNGNKRVVLPIVTNSNKQVIDGSRYKWLNSFLWLFRKKTRSYRYQRIFIRKGTDEFSNIANFRSQQVKLYIISYGFPFVKSVKVPMQVRLLRLTENKMNVRLSAVQLNPLDFSVKRTSPRISVPSSQLSINDFEILLPTVHPSIDINTKNLELDASINSLIAAEKLTEHTTNESILQLIN